MVPSVGKPIQPLLSHPNSSASTLYTLSVKAITTIVPVSRNLHQCRSVHALTLWICSGIELQRTPFRISRHDLSSPRYSRCNAPAGVKTRRWWLVVSGLGITCNWQLTGARLPTRRFYYVLVLLGMTQDCRLSSFSQT